MKEYKYDITIGMPVYGVEKYIRKCLDTVLNQTFQGKIEVLCVDDRGPDKSIEIIREIQNTHPKGNIIKVLTQPKNMGCWAARNRILEEAEGEYLLLIDSDDYLDIHAVEKMITVANRYHAEAVYGSVQSIDEDGNPKDFSTGDMKLPFKELIGKDVLASYANQNLHATLYNFIWNVLLRMDFLKKNNLQFYETRVSDDIIFETDMQPLIERAILIPDVTYYYLLRPGSLSNFQHRESIQLEEIMRILKVYSYIKNQAISLKGKPYYETRCAKAMIYMFYNICGALKNRKLITPHLEDKTIKEAIKHPLKFKDIIFFKKYRCVNLIFWALGIMPPKLAVLGITLIGKAKHLI